MPVTLRSGNLLHSTCDALVNTVNTVGVMGAGIALAFARRFPSILEPYRAACRTGELVTGRVQVLPLQTGQHVVNFPTKQDWRNPSQLVWIEQGLDALAEAIVVHGFHSVAVPALGCSLGRLSWSEVEPLIRAKLGDLPGVDIHLYAPR
jgi:O-acetyl-ADP-ribose deacetylase (regulator of RNase III)